MAFAMLEQTGFLFREILFTIPQLDTVRKIKGNPSGATHMHNTSSHSWKQQGCCPAGNKNI
jgi:hypothetical protein